MRHVVIYVPGLGDQNTLVLGYQKMVLRLWRPLGVRVEVMPMRWSDQSPFRSQFNKLTSRIDTLHKAGHTVSLVGVSAGASGVILAFLRAPEKIHSVVTICGKLHGSVGQTLRKINPRFGEAFDLLQKQLSAIPETDKKRILTIYSPLDYYVDKSQATLPGVVTREIRIPGHNLACALILLTGARLIIRFIKKH